MSLRTKVQGGMTDAVEALPDRITACPCHRAGDYLGRSNW